MVTHAGKGPHVVHGPYGWPHRGDPAYLAERQHALVDPAQHDGIGAEYLGMAAEREAVGGNGGLKEVGARAAVAGKDAQVLHIKGQARAQARGGLNYPRLGAAGAHHEHTGIDTIGAQRLDKAPCHSRGAAQAVAVIDKYSHRRGSIRARRPGSGSGSR